MKHALTILATVATLCGSVLLGAAPRQHVSHDALDTILDTYVREGRVYYRALQLERAPLDRYVRTLDIAPAELGRLSHDAQQAFWINAYNALVLQTVVSHYPIRGTTPAYPRDSIRQIPGAFDRLTHAVAGETLTLDAIEARVLREFGDARIVFALGRGAGGSGRLKSEAYDAARLDRQLAAGVAECAERLSCMALDRAARTLRVTPLVGWHTDAFERTFLSAAGGRWPARSPIERAVAAMLAPVVFPSERAFLEADTFRLEYGEFDWSLNEL